MVDAEETWIHPDTKLVYTKAPADTLGGFGDYISFTDDSRPFESNGLLGYDDDDERIGRSAEKIMGRKDSYFLVLKQDHLVSVHGSSNDQFVNINNYEIALDDHILTREDLCEELSGLKRFAMVDNSVSMRVSAAIFKANSEKGYRVRFWRKIKPAKNRSAPVDYLVGGGLIALILLALRPKNCKSQAHEQSSKVTSQGRTTAPKTQPQDGTKRKVPSIREDGSELQVEALPVKV